MVDLVISTNRPFSKQMFCKPHKTEHWSDHLAIIRKFLIDALEIVFILSQLYKNAN